MENSWIKYSLFDIYDGWILEFNIDTKEIRWRDHWIVDKITDDKKKEIEGIILGILKNKDKEEGK